MFGIQDNLLTFRYFVEKRNLNKLVLFSHYQWHVKSYL